jgi:hypothetical protein
VDHKSECRTATINSWKIFVDDAEVSVLTESNTFSIPSSYEPIKLEVKAEFSIDSKSATKFESFCGVELQTSDLVTVFGDNAGVVSVQDNPDSEAAFTAIIDHAKAVSPFSGSNILMWYPLESGIDRIIINLGNDHCTVTDTSKGDISEIDLEVQTEVSFTVPNPFSFDSGASNFIQYEVTNSSGSPMTAPNGVSDVLLTANADNTELTITFTAQDTPINTIVDYYLTAQIEGCFENPLISAQIYRVTWNRCDYDLNTLAVDPDSFYLGFNTGKNDEQEHSLPTLWDSATE